jgi:hypothetical protein
MLGRHVTSKSREVSELHAGYTKYYVPRPTYVRSSSSVLSTEYSVHAYTMNRGLHFVQARVRTRCTATDGRLLRNTTYVARLSRLCSVRIAHRQNQNVNLPGRPSIDRQVIRRASYSKRLGLGIYFRHILAFCDASRSNRTSVRSCERDPFVAGRHPPVTPYLVVLTHCLYHGTCSEPPTIRSRPFYWSQPPFDAASQATHHVSAHQRPAPVPAAGDRCCDPVPKPVVVSAFPQRGPLPLSISPHRHKPAKPDLLSLHKLPTRDETNATLKALPTGH